MKGSEPFYFERGNTGCILVHGFSSSPAEMRPLGDLLAEKKCTVKGILLKGHGTTPEDMEKTDWQNWYESVENGFDELYTKCDSVFVIGLSMGGLLGMHLAAQRPGLPLKGLVTLNTPIWFRNKKIYLLPVIKLYRRYYPVTFSEYRRQMNRKYNRFVYDRHPVKCIRSVVKLIRTVRKELKLIETPSLIVQSKSDRSIEPDSADHIYNNLGTADKKLKWYEKADHIITLDDNYKNCLYKDILNFIKSKEG